MRKAIIGVVAVAVAVAGGPLLSITGHVPSRRPLLLHRNHVLLHSASRQLRVHSAQAGGAPGQASAARDAAPAGSASDAHDPGAGPGPPAAPATAAGANPGADAEDQSAESRGAP